MTLVEYRQSESEQSRRRSLEAMMPPSGRQALDIGARDGYYSLLLAGRFEKVVALDLTMPVVDHPRVSCVAGNAAKLDFDDESMDFVFCAEVLEHIPGDLLSKVCSELERVCSGTLLIGVPDRQDIRVGRTTCYTCMQQNPPWGHVNSFSADSLASLFPNCRVESISYVGSNSDRTNDLACALMDLAGNPFGTYDQDEPCVHCGSPLKPPPVRNLPQKVLTKLGFWVGKVPGAWAKPRGNWMHMVLARR